MGRLELLYCTLRTTQYSPSSLATLLQVALPSERDDVAVGLICAFILRWKFLAPLVMGLTVVTLSRTAAGDDS